MEKMKPERYAFSCSVIRANENKILSKQDLDKLMDCKTVNQAMQMLADFGYGDGKQLENPRDFEEILKGGLAEVYNLVLSVVPQKEEAELFLYPSDYHNVKSILKAEMLKIDPAPYLVNTGNFSPEEITMMVRERNFIKMSYRMKRAINKALDIFAKAENPQEIDIFLDRACYKDMLDRANEIQDEFITGYIKLLIDVLNVNSFIRLRKIGKPVTFYRRIFIWGGNISQNFMLSSYEDNNQQLAEKMASFGFKEAFTVGAVVVETTGKYTALEKILDDMRMKYVKNAKYVSFGIQPIVGYLIAKETEIKNLRMILNGIISEIPKEITSERLRAPYV